MDRMICWNVRGANNPDKMKAIQQYLAEQQVGLACLLEIKVKSPNLGLLYNSIFNGWCFTSNVQKHYNGRIVLAWNPNSFTVGLEQMTDQIIHCVIKPSGGLEEFFCTFIYAHNDAKLRDSLWETLSKLNSKLRGPWLMMGDFNCVINIEERIGSAGGIRGTAMFKVIQKLKRVKTSLKELNKKGFNNLQAEDTKSYQGLVEIQEALHKEPLNTDLMQKEKDAVYNYNQAHKNYMHYLRQKAKASWIREEDDNTTLFHSCIRKRTLQNNVYAIRDMGGVMQDSPKGIQGAFVDYYKELLGKAKVGRAQVCPEII
ncbi:LINE-1 retrotransposable element ORF2 protein [Bienertia sinuspersici]